MIVKSRKKYTQKFKDQVVALLELGKPAAEVAQEMEISRDLVYSWKAKASSASPPGGRPPIGERHFKKSSGHTRNQTPIQRRAMIDSIRLKTEVGIRKICQVLQVPRSSYHASASPIQTQLDDEKLSEKISAIS